MGQTQNSPAKGFCPTQQHRSNNGTDKSCIPVSCYAAYDVFSTIELHDGIQLSEFPASMRIDCEFCTAVTTENVLLEILCS